MPSSKDERLNTFLGKYIAEMAARGLWIDKVRRDNGKIIIAFKSDAIINPVQIDTDTGEVTPYNPALT